MINANWELAADGTATKLVTCEDAVYWAKDGYFWDNNGKSWSRCDPDYEFITLATRQYQKPATVEDAVEALKHKVPASEDWEFIVRCKLKQTGWVDVGDFEFDCKDFDKVIFDFFCTREQFEQCVKARSEKWTHKDAFGDPCRILIEEPDAYGHVIVFKKDGWYSPVKPSTLKPIKPLMSQDAKRQLELYVQYRIDKYGDHAMKSDLSDYLSHHNIEEVAA